MKSIKISEKIITASKNMICLGVVFANVTVRQSDKELLSLLANKEAELKKQLSSPGLSISEIKGVKSLRETFTSLGKSVSKFPGSNESLLKRVASSKALYHINNIVEINNFISICSERSVGSYDLSQLEGEEITFRVGEKGESYTGTTKRPIDLQNLPVLCDSKAPFGSPYSDSSKALIKESTKQIVTIIFSFDGEEKLVEQLNLLEELFKKYADATDITKKIISRNVKDLRAA